jgi:hypothetical protein
MARLLGIVHMNPEKSRSEWSHVEVSFHQVLYRLYLLYICLSQLR